MLLGKEYSRLEAFLKIPDSTLPARFADLDKAWSLKILKGLHTKAKSVIPLLVLIVYRGPFYRYSPEIFIRVANLLVALLDDC